MTKSKIQVAIDNIDAEILVLKSVRERLVDAAKDQKAQRLKRADAAAKPSATARAMSSVQEA